MVLERGDPGDQWACIVAERLAHELERVAQPFAGDAQLMERLDIGPAQDRLVAAHLLVGGPDPGCGGVADVVRLGRPDRHHEDAFGPDEIAVVVDPASIAVRVELADEQYPCVVAMLAPFGEKRLQRTLLGDGHVCAICVGRVEQDVEVADRPESRGDLAQAVAVALRAPGAERGTEDAPGGPLSACRDPHRMELFRIRALARAGLAGEHPGEVEFHHLPAGLRDMVLGGDAGRLADDKARVDRSGLLGGLIDDVRGGRRDDHGLWHRCDGGTAGLLGSSPGRGSLTGLTRRSAPTLGRLGRVSVACGDGGRPRATRAWRLPIAILCVIVALPATRSDRGECRFELAPARRRECRIRGEDVGQRAPAAPRRP